jgi:hypothetical protein
MATDERDGSLAELERIGAEFGAEFVDALVRTAVLVRGSGVLLEVGDDSSRDRPYSRHERRLLTDIGFAPPRLVEPGTGAWSRALVGDECLPARVAQRAVWVARFRGLGGPLLPHDLALRHGHQPRRTEWIVSGGSSSALTQGG